ncbi:MULTISPECIES: hypothetical protein [unclassified Gordonia (in: high G+C Gram-positive bacteria)]|uniref:hypothetical protein n=1 Tax=unclassified Gordonia (in: high G+C Gram-positive bacteria) TaxID=2657482 RepID=UPI001FFE2F33|nr:MULTISPECIES: hypothetical protein [unclassified Gordonia (in: high G+C Gram-positive bacteria)]UQE75877.1 hypothetical protein MYK68_04520 [Gordonia sp. PP30]
MSATDGDWYYDVATGEVSRGKVPNALNRMGPYATEDDARRAIEIARERNAAADAEDED